MAENIDSSNQTKNHDEKDDINHTITIKIESYKNIVSKLKELINIIKGNEKICENKQSILEYIKFTEIFPFDKLKPKIYDIFKVSNNKELYEYLLNEIKISYNKEKTELNNQNEINIRIQLYKVFEILSYFISPSLIFNDDTNNKKKSLGYFINWIIKDNILTRSIINSYINIFDLYLVLTDYYSINRECLLSIEGTKKILYLIDILNLQNIFSYKFIINKRKILFYNINNLIYELYRTYNTSLNELNDISHYIVQFKKNKLSSDIVEKILNETTLITQINQEFKKFLIENLMINYSEINKDTNHKEKEIIIYFIIIINNNSIISIDYNVNWSILNEILNKYIKEKDFDKVINFLSNIKNNNNIDKYINNDIIKEVFKNAPFEKIICICDFIKNDKDLINELLNKNNTKNGIKLIKALKLNSYEYDKKYDEFNLNNFFYYKINSCLNDCFDILLSFALISEETYNTCIRLLLKNLYKEFGNKNNEDFSLPLNEDEDIEINDINNDNNNKKNNNSFNDIINFFINENKRKKNKENNDNLIIKKEKILTLYHFAKSKGLNLTDKNQKLFNKEFINDNSILNVNYYKYIPEDKYQPHDPSCITINIKTQKIIFVDNAQILKDNIKYFRKSKYIGIDSEWSSSSLNINVTETASILQLSNYNEKFILIIDLIKMKNDKEFFEVFKTNFKEKIFIGYAFNKSDIEQFFDELQEMFKDTEIVDLIEIYQNKYLEKAPSLKIMCEKILGKKMCKYEQCSYWENRPLKKSQLHYAALDAVICVTLYKILSKKD
jgi:hypothetical protein